MLFGLFYSTLNLLLSSLVGLLPTLNALPSGIGTAFIWAGGAIGKLVYIEPDIASVLIIVSIALYIETGIFFWNGINWLYRVIPFKFT